MATGRVSRALRCAAVGVVAVLATGCAVVGSGDGSGGGSGGDSGGGAGGVDAALSRVDRSALAEDERSAVDITDRFWRGQFRQTSGRVYRSPQVKGGYVGTNGPTCQGEPSVAFNAFYCPGEDFLAWDENLMATGYSRIGDAWVYLIIAHEWGHAIQARLARSRVSVAAELQADCLAGATIFGAARQGLVTLEPGDTEELAQTLAAVADDTPWTKERDHGDARERTASFSRGAQDGVAACLA